MRTLSPGPHTSVPILPHMHTRKGPAYPLDSHFYSTLCQDQSAVDRSKCAAARLSSAAERGPTSQTQPHNPLSTIASMRCAPSYFGAAATTHADSALSPSSFHHLGLATASHAFSRSRSKADAMACAQHSEPTGARLPVSR
eukprot:scaffold88044_cov75-Phaeocystis_antarctica.AAC.7